jgi:hypothetical protein
VDSLKVLDSKWPIREADDLPNRSISIERIHLSKLAIFLEWVHRQKSKHRKTDPPRKRQV